MTRLGGKMGIYPLLHAYIQLPIHIYRRHNFHPIQIVTDNTSAVA